MKGKFHFLYIALYFLIGILATVLLIVNGTDYYSLSLGQRVFSVKHAYLKPSGLIGHGLGILGSIMMIIGVATYMMRKRIRIFFHLGYLKSWLEFHIFLCTVGPILVLFHTAFKFGGIVAVSFWSMVLVVLSGFIGRFIYVQIPRTIQGHELTADELIKSESDLIQRMKEDYTLSGNLITQVNSLYAHKEYLHLTFWKSTATLFNNYFSTKKVLRGLRKDLINSGISDKHKVKSVLRIAKTKITLSRRIGRLRTMQKLFRYWHIFHLPFAISMFLIMLIHIAVTVAFGYKWIF